MTKEEAEAIINQIKRTCRGPLPAEARANIISHLQANEHEQARQLDEEARVPCGYNFNETILAGVFDGQIHMYQCPKCGVEGEYRAPLFEIA